MTETSTTTIPAAFGLDDLREMRDQLLTQDEVAAITRIPAGTLRRYRSLGLAGGTDPGPPSFRIGPKRVVYSSKALLAWVEVQLADAVDA